MISDYLLGCLFVLLYAKGNNLDPTGPQIGGSGGTGSYQVQDEEDLVRRAKQYDQEALTQLYEKNFDRIYRYVVLKIRERTEAEDITQQVFLSALKSISSFNYKGAPFSAWLYRIAHNQIVDYVRRKSKRATVALSESIKADDPGPGVLVERDMEMERVAKATKKLTKAQQEVISLRFTSEMSVAEVARIMGRSEGAVKALQHSAIAALRRALAEG